MLASRLTRVRNIQLIWHPPTGSPTQLDGYQPLAHGQIVSQSSGSVRLRVGTATVEVSALSADLFRVALMADGLPTDYVSEGVDKRVWPAVDGTIVIDGGLVRLDTGAATACIQLEPLRVWFERPDGRRFAEDDPDLGMGFLPATRTGARHVDAIGRPVRVFKKHPPTERYFGCGERTGGLDKTDSHQVFWNVSPPLGHTPAMSNLYTSIPFLLALDAGQAWGLFYDFPGQVEFDLASEQADRSWFGSIGNGCVYYVFAGPTPADVLDRYTELTGRTPMPPLWALGNQQSRWSYMDAQDLESIGQQFRDRDIPCDVLYLDIDYMDGYRVFTWDPERFPDPAAMLARLADRGFKVVTIVDPGVKIDEYFPVYTSGRELDVYCKTPEFGEYRNAVWPGLCAFPDFTSSTTRTWWGDWHARLLDAGVAGIWCDMNEPALFIPKGTSMLPDVVHPGDGVPRSHAEVHNLYGSLMAQAVREGLLRLRPDKRPFVISRAGYAGLQRHALNWTGDNSSWWEHLWMSMPQLQNLGLSGLGWAGVDVGGYHGNASAELLARWTEFGAFQPFCRNHAQQGTRHQEPWSFGEEYESVIRSVLQLRQRLLPYLYTLFEECHRTGAPILRPLLFHYPDDTTTYTADDEFLLGSDLLIAPITRAGTEHRHVYVPAGTWFHWWTGDRVDGPAHVLAHAPLGQPPLYVRANAGIPLWPVMRHVGEHPADPLTLVVFPSDAAETTVQLYEDSGDGFGYQDGQFARTAITCTSSAGGVRLTIGARVGDYTPERTRLVIEMRGLTCVRSVTVGGRPVADSDWTLSATSLSISVPATATEQVIEVGW